MGGTALLELTDETFHDFVASHRLVACVLYRGDAAAPCSWVAADGDDRAAPDRFAWGRLDLGRAPQVSATFRLPEAGDWLLLMGDRIVLCLEPLTRESAPQLVERIAAAARLDLDRVRSEVEREKASMDAVRNRRACPTTWRQR